MWNQCVSRFCSKGCERESVPLLSPSFWWLLAIFGMSQTVDTSPQSLPVCVCVCVYSLCISVCISVSNFSLLRTRSYQTCVCVYMHARWLQLCLTLCYPMDCSPPGSTVHRILQARIVEWVTIPFSRGSSWPRDWTQVSYLSCIMRLDLYHWHHLGSYWTRDHPKWPYLNLIICKDSISKCRHIHRYWRLGL